MSRRRGIVLVVDDDRGLRNAVVRIVSQAGYDVLEASDGVEGVLLFHEHRPDAVILDAMMPRMDGFEVCERIREADSRTPILFLTAKCDIDDMRKGFCLGADDYLMKPFGEEELVLRLGAVLRRSRAQESAERAQAFEMGDLSINMRTGETRLRGERVELTPKESRILVTLAEHPGELFEKNELVEAVWGREYLNTQISVAAYVRRIRQKIEDDPSEPRYLQTVWGYGYRLGDSAL